MQEEKLIHKQMIAVLNDVEAIEKERRNNQGSGYNFRGIDDVYNAMHPIFAKHGIFVVPIVLNISREERETSKGTVMIYTMLTVKYVFYAIDGSNVEATVVGEAFDTGDKSANKAMSAAMKYAILQTFCIPTVEDKDTENDSPDVKPRAGATPGPKVEDKASADEAKKKKSVTEGQIKRLYAIMNQHGEQGWNKGSMEEVAIAAFGLKDSLSELNMWQYDKLVGWIEKQTYDETVKKVQAWLDEKAKKSTAAQ